MTMTTNATPGRAARATKNKAARRGKPGRIESLSVELRALIDNMLAAGSTQADILRKTQGILAEQGEPPLSAGGLNRYTQKVTMIGQRVRESREIAKALTAQFGDKPDGEVTQLLLELLRTVAFQFAWDGMSADEAKGNLDIAAIGQLSLAINRLESAAKNTSQRERDIRNDLADRVEEASKGITGLSKDSVKLLRAAIEGDMHG